MTAAVEDAAHDVDAAVPLHTDGFNDPPPPYPTPRRSRRAGGTRRSHPPIAVSHHPQLASDSASGDEHTAFLLPRMARHTSDVEQAHTRTRSDSSGSMWSTISGSPSLAQTVFTFFEDVDVDSEADDCAEPHSRRDSGQLDVTPEPATSASWRTKLRRYLRPLRKKVYYMSLVHLLLVNFPMALVAWIVLFVLTLLGTTLLVVLPLGLFLSFLNLFCARLLSRFELHLQMKFHFPSASLRRKPPIFTRPRPQGADEETPLLDSHDSVQNVLLDETSFYKNSYAMFTDPTSYHALFYFLVIKPPITLLFTLFMFVIVVPMLIGGVTAPAALRLTRRMGVWQAAVAVEGLAGEA